MRNQISPSFPTPNQADIEHQLDSLRSEHRDIEKNLTKLSHDTLADDLHIKRLKQRKLKIKDSIASLENNLVAAEGT